MKGTSKVELEVTFLGYPIFISAYLSLVRRLLVVRANSSGHIKGWHAMIGPLHIWSMGPKSIDSFFRIGINFSRDPFWGTAISVPSGFDIIFGSIRRP